MVKIVPRQFKNRLTILAHPRGKAALDDGTGRPNELARALLARGHAVVAFDPLFVGESLDPRNPVPHRPTSTHFETYNPVTAADQMQDLATIVAWAKSRPDVDLVNLVAQDDAGYQALVARPDARRAIAHRHRAFRHAPGRESPTNGRPPSTFPGLSNSAV